MSRGHPLSVTLCLLLEACAVTADDCDPAAARNVLKAGACDAGGLYAARQARLQAEVAGRAAEERRAAEQRQRSEAEAARLAAERVALEQRLAGVEAEVVAMQGALTTARGERTHQQAALGSLRRRSGELRRRAAVAPPDDQALRAEIEALTRDVEARRQAIAGILHGMAAE